MSADNWAVCPRCKIKRDSEIQAEMNRVAASYGNVPVEEFDAARSLLADKINTIPDRTFREDYEFYGVEDGTLHISYSGNCGVCGLTFTHQSEHPLPV
jgi:hypothetical protein